MDLKNLFSDEDAVSPVIGVILMVAITVILAAVIGTFVLGLGDQVQSSAPNANFQFEYAEETIGSDTTQATTVTHNGGQDVDADNVEVQIDGETAWAVGAGPATENGFTGTLSTGSSATFDYVNDDGATGEDPTSDAAYTVIEGGDTVRVIWTSPNGGSSNTIGSSTVPS